MRRFHFSFPLILLVSLALLTFWLDRATLPRTTVSDDDFYLNPDYIVENISGIRMDHQRVVHRTFLAEKMLHYLNEDATYLEQVRFINTQPDSPVIRLRADQAKLYNSGENIYLTGNVAVLRGVENEDMLTMMTNSLHLIPGENLVKTDQSVTISRLNTTVKAIGMEFDNDTGMVQLLSRVRAVDH